MDRTGKARYSLGMPHVVPGYRALTCDPEVLCGQPYVRRKRLSVQRVGKAPPQDTEWSGLRQDYPNEEREEVPEVFHLAEERVDMCQAPQASRTRVLHTREWPFCSWHPECSTSTLPPRLATIYNVSASNTSVRKWHLNDSTGRCSPSNRPNRPGSVPADTSDQPQLLLSHLNTAG